MVKLLIVDDESDICEFLRDFFEERNYEVFTALTGDAALSLVEEKDPAIVLLDIKMPGANGIDILRTIKQRHPHVKTIMVTAVETEEAIREALSLGADSYITKPLSLEYLESEVEEKIRNLENQID
jgi:DNA-binding response OmpR family regulator